MKMKMQDYVRHSPIQIKSNLANMEDLLKPIIKRINQKEYRSIYFIASGSSYNSALMILPLWQKNSLDPVYLVTPEDIIRNGYNAKIKPLFIVISQSGSSTNIIECLTKLSKSNCNVIVLTGYIDSPAQNYTKSIFDYGVGNEYVDFVTQGVHTLYEFLLFLEIKLLEPKKFKDEIEVASNIYEKQELTLELTQKFINKNKIALSTNSPIIFVGSNYNFGVAKEFALKAAETLKRPGIYYETEEFLHGPDMQIRPGYTIYLLDDYPSNSRIIDIYKGLSNITNHTYLITTNYRMQADKNSIIIPKPESAEYYVFEVLLVFQLICSELSEELQTWATHPFFDYLEKKLKIKSSGYEEELRKIKAKWDEGKNDTDCNSNSRSAS